MIESGYYPPGAEFDPRAPWNEQEIPEKEFTVRVCQELHKTTQVTTDQYSPEADSDGYLIADTSDTVWDTVYSEQHLFPMDLINLFSDLLEAQLKGPNITKEKYEYYTYLLNECNGWKVDNTDVTDY